jgi:hypothetical protein
MSAAPPSKYVENQFLVATVNRFALMSEVLADTLPRATTATAGQPAFTAVLAALSAAAAAWNTGESTLANAAAALPASTYALEDKLASLTRKPDADTPSLIESWDILIRSQVAFRSPVYRSLLPQGRKTVTAGRREDQLDALRDLGLRLAAQAGKPALIALGAIVTTFANAARALRNAQINAKAALETARQAQEARRVTAAAALYALIGQGIVTWSATPALVDTLWNVNLLRRPARRPAPRKARE